MEDKNLEPAKLNSELTDAMNKSIAGAVKATQELNGGSPVGLQFINPNSKSEATTTNTHIQKRGFTYPGDSNMGFGLYGNGLGLHGFTHNYHGAPYWGRGPAHHQPFGITPFGVGGFGRQIPSATLGDVNGAGVAISESSHIAHWKMASAVEAYKGFGVIKNVIDLMCNFASEGITIQHPRPSVKRFYERWAKHVDLAGRIKDMLRYYYKYGNVFVYTTMGSIDDSAYNRMRRTRGDSKYFLRADVNDPSHQKKLEDIEEEARKPEGQRLIPWKYTLLNPFQMDLRGTKFFGGQRWVFILDELTFADLKNKQTKKAENIDFLDETEVNLPPEFQQLVDGRIVNLDQAKLWTIHYMKDDHEDWADPMVWPIMNDIHYKNKLRAMDISACDSVINAITVFKLGDISEGYVAPESHYDKLSEMLRTPTAAMTMVWNDALEIESNYPPVHQILGVEKYEAVDRDILAGLGISEVIVNGRGGNYANSFLSVRTLLERLEDGRTEVIKWVDRQLRMIAAIMGHRDVPHIKFGQMSLRDEQKEKQLIMNLLDRNVISIEAVHETFGLDFNIEQERMKREKEIEESEGIFVQHGPFRDPLTDFDEEDRQDREDERLEKQGEMRIKERRMQRREQRRNIQQNGRPVNTGRPQQTRRDTKPQGMAFVKELMSFKSLAMATYTDVEEHLTSRLLESRGLKYKKALSKSDRDGLENLSVEVFSRVRLGESSGRSIDAVMGNIKNSINQIAPIVNELKQDFIQINDREPNAHERREIYATARATWEMEK